MSRIELRIGSSYTQYGVQSSEGRWCDAGTLFDTGSGSGIDTQAFRSLHREVAGAKTTAERRGLIMHAQDTFGAYFGLFEPLDSSR